MVAIIMIAYCWIPIIMGFIVNLQEYYLYFIKQKYSRCSLNYVGNFKKIWIFIQIVVNFFLIFNLINNIKF